MSGEESSPAGPQPEPQPPLTPEEELRGGRREFTSRDVATSAGVSLGSTRRLWRALGYPRVDENELAFTAGDAAALERVVALVRSGVVDQDTIIAWARALGQSTERLVSWQVESLAEYLATKLPKEQVAEALRALMTGMWPEAERLVVYGWRHKLADALERLNNVEDPTAVTTQDLTVGFADLVAYSTMSLELDHRELSALVQRFEGLSADVVTTGGGRLIKNIGDEVLFVANDPEAAAIIAVSLAEHMSADPMLPEVRVGLAHGRVLLSLGDVYGPTVNLASRLTALAEPGMVVTDANTGALLVDVPDLVLVPQRRRQVRGFGWVQPLLVTKGTQGRGIVLDDV